MFNGVRGLVNPYASTSSAVSFQTPDMPIQPDESGMPTVAYSPFGMPMSFWIGAIVLVLVLKWVSEREGTEIRPAHIHIGGYNSLAIVLSWLIGWAIVKLIVSRWFPNSGAAAFVNWL